MNRHHWAVFHAVAAARSISGAAATLRVSQPGVSRQIAELEADVGMKLLERLPRGCRLTPAGEVLARGIERWMAVEHDARLALEDYRTLRRGRLTLGASQTIAAYLLPGLLASLRRAHPAIELDVRVANTRAVEDALRRGEVEAGLTEGPPDGADLERREFRADTLAAVVPRGHRLFGAVSVDPAVFAREPWIARETGSGTREVAESAFLARGLTLKPSLTLASSEAVKNAVAAGLGVALMSTLVVESECRAGLLAAVALKGMNLRRPLHVQRLKNREPSAALRAFLVLLQAPTKPGVPGS